MPPNKLEDRLAIIDLGSNTFHLLIVEKQNEAPGFRELYRERQFLYISSDGLSRIPEVKLNAALDCLRQYREVIDQFNCQGVTAVGTAMLRSASNGRQLIDRIYEETGIELKLISGEREAQLIYEGNRLLQLQSPRPSLIMDIGGGSVEFIIQSAGSKDILDFQSHNIGISVLRKSFELGDPVSEYERKLLFESLDSTLDELVYICNELNTGLLIGSSGPFEILESMMGHKSSPRGNVYDVNSVLPIKSRILQSGKSQRTRLPGMPAHRADLAKESFLLIDYVLSKVTGLQELVVSPYALKEGLISEYFKFN